MVITEPAEADLKEIADYIANKLLEPSTAKHLITKISESIFELDQVPKQHALYSQIELLANKRAPVFMQIHRLAHRQSIPFLLTNSRQV
ncbi:ParE toxin of type II toxin-antitoxin system, parDE [Tenuibacillus multivorans]|uniref:ParE toxin of type II toxin-antitoxin system, parDE n=1 Tax=Tenuibacillus multivorans TaxID=237069 RepID=A0A1H0ATZ0_9BACI|nr:ParE toxin of type II toxin-antitoxin system, parDE [Tenuibacillus multivorans]